MVFRKQTIVVIILILSFLGGPFVYKTYAADWFAAMKFALDIAAKAAAQTAFKILSNRVISKIRTGGPGGKAAFVQNWIKFQTEAQYQGEAAFRAILGNTNLCNYFSDDLKKIFQAKAENLTGRNIRVGNLDPFTLRANCTLPSNFNLANYKNDFSGNGGWDAWARMMEPSNNPYGVFLSSLDEVARQRDLSEKSATNKVMGHGFTGFQGACKKIGAGNNCILEGDIKTPGGVLNLSVANVLDGNVKFFTTADAASMVISALVGFATEKLFDLANSDTSNNGTDLTNDDSYKNEFCTAKDDMSFEAVAYVIRGCPDSVTGAQTCIGAIDKFPAVPGMGSYCEKFRSDDNSFPFDRCVQSCFKALGILPAEVTVPTFTATPPPTQTPTVTPPGTCPIGLSTGTLNHADVVATVINQIGPTQTTHTPCDQFEITKNVAWRLRGEGAGLQKKTSGTNCQGFSVDIIAYPNGDTYDVVSDLGTTWGATWSPSCRIDPATQYAPAFDPGTGGTPPPGGSGGSLRGFFSSGTGTVLDYTTSGLCVDAGGVSGAIIRRDGADIFLITSNDPDLPAGTRIDSSPPSGNHTYALFDAGCGDPSKQVQLGTISITVP